jgi:hypothetical protein
MIEEVRLRGESSVATDEREGEVVRAGMGEAEMRANLVRLAFGGDLAKLQEFCSVLVAALPPDTAAVIRGSAVTGVRWEDGAPFDEDGPGTSDLDLTLVGGEVVDWFDPDAFYIPGVHSKPLCDERLEAAPSLVPLRQRLSDLVGRPVNIQATKDWIMFVREHLMGQPYLTLIGKVEDS